MTGTSSVVKQQHRCRDAQERDERTRLCCSTDTAIIQAVFNTWRHVVCDVRVIPLFVRCQEVVVHTYIPTRASQTPMMSKHKYASYRQSILSIHNAYIIYLSEEQSRSQKDLVFFRRRDAANNYSATMRYRRKHPRFTRTPCDIVDAIFMLHELFHQNIGRSGTRPVIGELERTRTALRNVTLVR